MTVYASLLGTDTGMALAHAIARSILASRLQSFNRSANVGFVYHLAQDFDVWLVADRG